MCDYCSSGRRCGFGASISNMELKAAPRRPDISLTNNIDIMPDEPPVLCTTIYVWKTKHEVKVPINYCPMCGKKL